jgi:biopolymer transport protein ExbB
MLEVFDSMAILGSADARSMASGVSKAMNCTLTGLAVSISGMYPVYYFHNRIRRQTELLSDQFEY